MKIKSHREQIASKCIHFNGISNSTCKAGVPYATLPLVPRNEDGTGKKMPCFFECDTCDKVDKPTEEYIQSRLDACKASFERISKVIAAIKEHSGGKRGSSGYCVCPTCGKELHYSISGYNGHIHARCETDGCVAFMQ